MLKILILFLISFSANAYFNPEPDSESALLGAKYTGMYDSATYFCDTKPDGSLNTNGDTLGSGTIAAPYETFSKMMTLIAAVSGLPDVGKGQAFALCRGGKFYSLTNTIHTFNGGRRNNQIYIRDYQLPDSSRSVPEIIVSGSATNLFNFNDAGGGDSEEGLTVKNLKLTSRNFGGNGFYCSNDCDYVTLDNIEFVNLSAGFSFLNYDLWTPQNRCTAQTVNDLVFTHVGGGAGDTISGTWTCAAMRRGDAVVITGSLNNNKTFRVASVAGNVITLDDHVQWNVVNESATVGVSMTIDKSDGFNTSNEAKNILVHSVQGSGYFGGLDYYSSIHDSEFYSNSFNAATTEHNIYLSSSAGAADIPVKLYNNRLRDNAPYQPQGSLCRSVSLVMHGHGENIEIYNNDIYQRVNNVADGCYAIQVSGAYVTAYQEGFLGMNIHDNKISNLGGEGIGIENFTGSITGNIITNTRTNGFLKCIVLNDSTYRAEDLKSGDITVTGNVCNGTGSAASQSAGAVGIELNATATDTLGTWTINTNTISDITTCIDNNVTGGATVVLGANTTSNCL